MSNAVDITDPPLTSYVQGWTERARRRAAADAAWRDKILARIDEVVALLRDDFGVRRILLFGSFARGEAKPGSDLDLLVDDLPNDRLIEATSALERLLKEVDVDLVLVRSAYPAIKARAESEGTPLYG